MKIIRDCDDKKGIEMLAGAILLSLKTKNRVLWLISGGSNISVAKKVFDLLNSKHGLDNLNNLTISLVDERYGMVGHKDSNWQQLLDSGFDLKNINYLRILRDKSLEQTTIEFENEIIKAFKDNYSIISQLGIGADGHIAGILPNSPATISESMVCGYKSEKFSRITLTEKALKQADQTFVFAFGENKKQALEQLQKNLLSYNEMPCVLLNQLDNVYIFTDQK